MTDLLPAVADIKTQIPNKTSTTEHFIFFAGRRIPPQIMATIPYMRFGGIILENSNCLKYRHQYLRRGEITQLRIFWDSTTVINVNPTEAKHLPPYYELHEGGTTRLIGTVKNKDGEVSHDGLLRNPFYPSWEIEKLTSQNNGVIEMPVKDTVEALQAQMFLFPDWKEIFFGEKPFPERTIDLRHYFEERKTKARTDVDVKVADVAILSCDQYLNWCNLTASRANASWNEMQVKGHPFTMPEGAEAAFLDSTIQRRDTVAQDQSNQLSQMTAAVATIAQSVASQRSSPAGIGAPLIDDEEYQRYLRFKAFEASQQAPQPEIIDTNFGEFGQCKATTNSGDRCKQRALPNGYCPNVSHQAQGSGVGT